MMETFEFTINYEGRDLQIIADNIEAAELLLNEQFLTQFDLDNFQGPLVLQSQESLPDKSMDSASSSKIMRNEQIWCRKKPTETDLQATKQLLQMRQDMAAQFDDKKTIKAKLWHRISSELEKSFNLGANGAEKCRQKFSNLQRAYLSYVRQQKTTGSGKNDETPPFFDEIHSVIGSKAKVNPNFLEDSMEESSENENSTEANTLPTASTSDHQNLLPTASTSDHKDRFKSVRKNLRPMSKTDMILKELQADRESQERQFSIYSNHLKKSEEQKDRFLEIIGAVFSRKRKRTSSESD